MTHFGADSKFIPGAFLHGRRLRNLRQPSLGAAEHPALREVRTKIDLDVWNNKEDNQMEEACGPAVWGPVLNPDALDVSSTKKSRARRSPGNCMAVASELACIAGFLDTWAM